MTRRTACAVLALLITLFPAAVAFAGSGHSGLWVGTVHLTQVSGVNRSAPDLALDIAVDGIIDDHVLLAAAADGWQHTQQAPPAGWERHPDVGTWTTGAAPLRTQSGETAGHTYLRRRVTVDSSGRYSRVRLRVWYDDAVAVYWNGTEVLRDNLAQEPGGPLHADQSGDGAQLAEVEIPARLVQSGDNQVAAELLMATGSTEGYFDLEVVATATDQLLAAEAPGWGVLATNTPQAAGWASSADAGWSTEAAPLLRPTADASEMPRTLYARRTLDLAHAYDRLRLSLRYDDGVAVFWDGTEVVRANLPDGPITAATTPVSMIGPDREGRFATYDVSLTGTQGAVGSHPLAAEVHAHPSELDPATDPAVLLDTPAPLRLRVILHEDPAGSGVRLLKEGFLVRDATGTPFIIAEHTRLPEFFEGRGGTPSAQRVSAVTFDFPSSEVPCQTADGAACSIDASGGLTFSFQLPANLPSNPFLHRYHPDHDNWDERFERQYPEDPAAPAEAFAVQREIRFQFDTHYPPSDPDVPLPAPLAWGGDLLGGSYSETVTGLHRDAIRTAGWFVIERVAPGAARYP